MPRRRERLMPRFVPQWLQRRVELDTYVLFDFVERSGASVVPGSRVLDAGAGAGRFCGGFAHTRYTGVDLAVGDAAVDYSGLDAICTLTALPFAEGGFDAV